MIPKKLVLLPSLSLSPVAPVLPVFSLPARSTKLIAEYFLTILPFSCFFYFNSTKTIVCALELVAFIKVA